MLTEIILKNEKYDRAGGKEGIRESQGGFLKRRNMGNPLESKEGENYFNPGI